MLFFITASSATTNAAAAASSYHSSHINMRDLHSALGTLPSTAEKERQAIESIIEQ